MVLGILLFIIAAFQFAGAMFTLGKTRNGAEALGVTLSYGFVIIVTTLAGLALV